MIHINLLPGANKKTTSRRGVNLSGLGLGFSGMFKDRFLIGAASVVVLSLGAVGYLYVSQNAKTADLEAHRDRAVSDSTHYANFLKDRWHAEAVRDTLLRQVNLIKSLDEDRFVWAHVMDEVSRALPQYTWLTAVSFTGTPQGAMNVVASPATKVDTSAAAKKKAHVALAPKRLETDIPRDAIGVRVSGHTVDIQALTRFMKDLEASPFLTNVQLDRSELALELNKEVTQFQLTIGYNRPDSTVIRRVPLTLSAR
jgi:Tfp pilus assembly protein PilN